MKREHENLVEAQFGPRAKAYVESAVHSGGEDLAALAGLAATLRPARAIDIGAGGGHVSYALAKSAGNVVACDLSTEMLAAVATSARARGLDNIETVEASADALPFPDAEFDFVASRFSAHHWRNFSGGLREARRVARPGATAVFIDVFASEVPLFDTHLQAIELLRDPSHVRNHTLAQWFGALGIAGFSLKKCHTWRLRMDFPTWIARMATSETHAQAILSLQRGAATETASFFEIEPDGSFQLEVHFIEATAV